MHQQTDPPPSARLLGTTICKAKKTENVCGKSEENWWSCTHGTRHYQLCSVMQRITVKWSVVQCSALLSVQAGSVRFSAVQCSVLQCGTVHCSVLQCKTVHYSVLQCGTEHCSYSNASQYKGIFILLSSYLRCYLY